LLLPRKLHVAGDDTTPLVYYKVLADEQKPTVMSFLSSADA